MHVDLLKFEPKTGDWDVVGKVDSSGFTEDYTNDNIYPVGLYKRSHQPSVWSVKYPIPEDDLPMLDSFVIDDGVLIDAQDRTLSLYKVIQEVETTNGIRHWVTKQPWEFGLEWEHMIDPSEESVNRIIDILDNSAFENPSTVYRLVVGGRIRHYVRYREFGVLSNPVTHIFYVTSHEIKEADDEIRNILKDHPKYIKDYHHYAAPNIILNQPLLGVWRWIAMWEIDLVKDIQEISDMTHREIRYKGYWYLTD